MAKVKALCWQRSLQDDIHWNLRKREMKLPTFIGQSPQLSQRRWLVEWLTKIWEIHDICSSSRQLTVSLLDFFMDMFDIEARQLQLVALGCFILATKFEEQDVAYPRLCDLRKAYPGLRYTNHEFLHMELLLLDFFKWNICLPTPAHFIDSYMEYFLDDSDLHRGKPISDLENLKKHLRRTVTYFLEQTLKDQYYRYFRPSHVAASCIACSRVCLCIDPPWNAKQSNFTAYNLSILTPLMDVMLRMPLQAEMQSAPTLHCESLQLKLTPPTTPELSGEGAAASSKFDTPRSRSVPGVYCSMDTPATPPYHRV